MNQRIWMSFKIAVRITFVILAPIAVLWAVFFSLTHDLSIGDPVGRDAVFIGERARQEIRLNLPMTAHGLYAMNGGNWSGSITYWAFSCATVEECWAVIESERFPLRASFQPWKPSKYAVVMQGPAFYGNDEKTPLWDVNGIRNGAVYETVEKYNDGVGCRRMTYWAIDFDRRRVYYHSESGGFPCDQADSPRPVDSDRT